MSALPAPRQSPAARLRGVLNNLGVADGLLFLGNRFLELVSRNRLQIIKYYFVSQPVATTDLLPAHRGRAIEVVQIDRSHPLVSVFPRPAHVIAQRFDSGARCFLATKGDEFLGFLWLKTTRYDEDEVRCTYFPLPAEETVWDFDVLVAAEHRNGFAFAKLWSAAYRQLRAERVRWSVSRISAFNADSINSHARLGAFPIAKAVFLVGRRWQLMLSDASPHVHLSFNPASVPTLSLSAEPASRKRYRRFGGRESKALKVTETSTR